MAKHAILSPSSASRWLACTPAARFEEQFPDRAGEAAAEGTLAHSLAELLLRKHFDLISEAEYEKQIKAISANKLFSSEMRGHADDYADFVIERFNEAKAHTPDAILFLEQKLNLTDYIPEGFGTGDAIIIADGMLDIIDLKYGKGVPVFSTENKQMMLYALGALREFDYMYRVDRVRMTIYQPRIDNVSDWDLPASDLKQWATDELRPKAEMAFKGEGEYVPGPHCQFCKAKAVCKALADQQLEIAKYEFKDANRLTDADVADILNRADQFSKWIKAIEETALYEAVNNGKKWPGYKLVEGRSNRVYTDQDKVAVTLLKAGFAKEIIYKPKELLGITAMEKTLGKKVFSLHLDELTIKPTGKATLVHESDKRPELNSLEKAKADFAPVETEE